MSWNPYIWLVGLLHEEMQGPLQPQAQSSFLTANKVAASMYLLKVQPINQSID